MANMNKPVFKIASILILLFVAFPVFAEEIRSFDVEIKINVDSSISVAEKIAYDFGNLQRHGIYRDIPVKYKARGGNYNLRISDIFVTDESGNPLQFTVSNEGSNKRIKIGDANSFVSGENNYVINYVIRRGLNFFADHDELYWNVNGNGWGVSSGRVSARVSFPENIEGEKIRAECFEGIYGSTEKCYESGLDVDIITGKNVAYFVSSELRPAEGLTIVAGFPKGVVVEPSFSQSAVFFLKDNWIAGFPVAVFGFMFWLWHSRGRDPKGRGTIIAQYDVPDKLTPSQVGALIDERADNKDVSAEIVNLAVKGYLKINRLPAKIKILGKDDYRLDKIKKADENLGSVEQKLFASLFDNNAKKADQGALESVKLSKLKNKFYQNLSEINAEVLETLVDLGYFPKNPQTVRLIYIAVAFLAGVTLFFSSLVLQLGAVGIISAIISFLTILAFGLFMPTKSSKGVASRDHILGLKTYLQVAEKDRIEFHNAPQKNPEIFEKFLPYAMVLGVEKEWAKQFEDIYKNPPDWYGDPSGRAFSAAYLASSMNGFSDSAKSTMASTPSSASSGGSGFSGGGSGGGFGGGGGGSW